MKTDKQITRISADRWALLTLLIFIILVFLWRSIPNDTSGELANSFVIFTPQFLGALVAFIALIYSLRKCIVAISRFRKLNK